jgi:hypothetical protein
MHPIERVMRVMTHLNIGLALGMVGWIAWSGVLVVSGELPVRLSVPTAPTTAAPAPAAYPQVRGADPSWPPCCLVPAEPGHPTLQTLRHRDIWIAAMAPEGAT